MSKLSAQLKFERAEEHITDLKVAWGAFLTSHPYKIIFEDDLQAQTRSWRITDVVEVPETFSTIVGDGLQNLRSALDHLIHSAILKETGAWPTKRIIGFPIGKDATKYAGPKFGGKLEGLGDSAKQIIASLKPYQGGNSALWRLHTLNNIDKHRLLLTAQSSLAAHRATPAIREDVIRTFREAHPNARREPDFSNMIVSKPRAVDFPLKNGSKLLTVSIAELEDHMSFTFDIAFNEAPFKGELVFDTFGSILLVVKDVIDRFRDSGLV